MGALNTVIHKQALQQYSERCQEADVFSRGALEQSFRLLRPSHPGLAMVIQNILNGQPIEKPEEFMGDKRTDNFRIRLEAEQIQAILNALVSQASVIELKKIQGNVTALGNLVIIKSLIEDWVRLAKGYIEAAQQNHSNVLPIAQGHR